MAVGGHRDRGITAILLLLLAGTAAAATIHVTPASNLADAVSLAAEGDTLAFGCGVYLPDGIQIDRDLVLRGSAGEAGCVILEASGQTPVIRFLNVTNQARVEHLTFTMAEGTIAAGGLAGAALNLVGSSPNVHGCRFLGLSASHGGAVYVSDGSMPIFTSCRFEGNRAAVAGGAIMCGPGSGATVATSLFHDNAAEGTGGAIHAALGSHLSVLFCTLDGNSGAAGSGLSAWDGSPITVRSSIITGGGGSPGWVGDTGSVPVITCTDIFGNSGGDWVGLLAGQAAGLGNFAADPQYCTTAALSEPYLLDLASPCLATLPECGAWLGAFPVGCGSGSGAETPSATTRLLGNRPNPFNPATVIHFELGLSGPVTLEVFDVAGRRLRRLLDAPLVAGAHAVEWNGRDEGGRPVAAGVYYYRLQAPDAQDIRSMVLVK